jgi:RNA polymerase sigma factor (sigma-70 family)
MKSMGPVSFPPRRHSVVVAMVLGTAMSSLGVQVARADSPEAADRAVTEISRYCTACWRNARLSPDCWTDCTQDVLTRLLQRVRPEAWGRVFQFEGEERREFFRAIDTVKKRAQRTKKWSPVEEDAVADRLDGQRRERADDRATVAEAATEVLTLRQQRIMQLSFEGWSVQEIADELAIGPERVSDEKYKAVRKLRTHLGSDAEA